MVRKTALIALVALLVVGGSAAALGAAPSAMSDTPVAQDDAPMAQDETTEENETDDEMDDDEMDNETTAVETMVAENETENASVTFENQTSNGSAVVVNESVLPEGGFVVIHTAANVSGESYDDPANVSIGPVIGNSTYLEAGTHENVTVELNETLNASQPLVAMAHQDTDDDQQYNFPEADGPYTQDNLPVVDLANVTLEDGENATEMGETTEMMDDETTEEDGMTETDDEETTTEE